MKNTIDNILLSTSTTAKGLDGIAAIVSPEADSDVQGFETTFRQALAAIDSPRSGKDLPKELLEFDPEKLAGMALTQKKLSSDSSVLIGDADLSNQTVIAFAALQGMDAESLKTLFEKPVSNKEQQSRDTLVDLSVSTDGGLLDDFVEMPPGSVEQTVRALEEQGLLPGMPVGGLKEKLSSEDITKSKLKLSEGLDSAAQISEGESALVKKAEQDGNTTNNWLSQRAREEVLNPGQVIGAASHKSADFSDAPAILDAVDSNSDGVPRDPVVTGKGAAEVFAKKDPMPEHPDFKGVPSRALELKNSEVDLNTDYQKKINLTSGVNVNVKENYSPERGSQNQIEITSGFVNSSGSRQEKGQPISELEQPVDFELMQQSKDKKRSSAQSSNMQMTRAINEITPQSQYVSSIGPVKPIMQQAQLTGILPAGEIAALEPMGSSSDSNPTSDTLNQPKGLGARVAVDDLPGKLTALVQQRIVNGLKVEGWRYQVHLHPEELGSVEIKMEMIDGRLEARILASNVAARDLLSEHLAKLEESLQNGGIKESMVQVGLEQRQDPKKSFGPSEDSQESQNELVDSEESTAKDKRKSNDGELDLFV